VKTKLQDQKLGLVALVAIVVSSMIGSGVDSLPQNMAETSALGPVVIAWIISGFGMYFIAKTFMVLSDLMPDLQSGIYMYARDGFGPFSAFVVAWGYWLMTMFSNVVVPEIFIPELPKRNEPRDCTANLGRYRVNSRAFRLHGMGFWSLSEQIGGQARSATRASTL